MTTYWIREDGLGWKECKATTLTGAKISASHNQFMQGTTIFVGMLNGSNVESVAIKEADPINMSIVHPWRDV